MADDEKPKESDDSREKLVEVIERQAESNAQIAAAISAQNAAKDAPPADDYEARRTAWEERKKAALANMDELAKDGKFSEGLAAYEKVLREQPAPKAQDPTSHPIYKATAHGVRKEVLGENTDLNEWKDEIDEELKKLDANAAVDHASVREAVGRIRVRHAQEIVDRQVEEKRKELIENTPAVPDNVPIAAFGENAETDLHDLSAEDRATANALGVPYEEYKQQLKNDDKADKFGTVPIL